MKEKIVKMLINQGISQNAITDDARLMHDLGLDSLDFEELTMMIEEEFNIEIPVQDYPQLATVSSVVQYLHSKIEKPNFILN